MRVQARKLRSPVNFQQSASLAVAGAANAQTVASRVIAVRRKRITTFQDCGAGLEVRSAAGQAGSMALLAGGRQRGRVKAGWQPR